MPKLCAGSSELRSAGVSQCDERAEKGTNPSRTRREVEDVDRYHFPNCGTCIREFPRIRLALRITHLCASSLSAWRGKHTIQQRRATIGRGGGDAQPEFLHK